LDLVDGNHGGLLAFLTLSIYTDSKRM
jgi:hypothetical protein